MSQGHNPSATIWSESLPAGPHAVYRQVCLVAKRDASRPVQVFSTDEKIRKFQNENGLERLAVNDQVGLLLWYVPDDASISVEETIERVSRGAAGDGIESVELNRIAYPSALPDDPLYPEQWAWQRVGAEAAWACLGSSTRRVVVAVVDSGVDRNHEDFQGCLEPTLTVITGETRDDEDHGTLVAGTIGAITNNTRGVAGAAKVRVLPVKFCSQQVWPSAALGAFAIIDAASNGANVINLSWDLAVPTDALRVAIEDAGAKDAVVVVAAGNNSLDNDKYPNWPANYGDMNHVITVMATDKPDKNDDDERASYSNYGATSVHIAAPGADILSTAPYSLNPRLDSIRVGYRAYSGTSAAAAFVSGLAALIRIQNPGWTAIEVKDHVLASARQRPRLRGLCVTEGIVDYKKAICG